MHGQLQSLTYLDCGVISSGNAVTDKDTLLATMNRTVAKFPGLDVGFDNKMCLAVGDLIARGFAQGSPVLHGRNSMDADVARE